MKRYFIFLTFSFLANIAFGQDQSPLKRTPYKLIVAVDPKSSYEEEIQATAYVLPNKAIQLYPGETVYVEVEQDNGNIKSLTAVKEIKDSSKTLIISFTQTVKNKAHELVMLDVKNPFKFKLIYKAKIYILNSNRWASTDVYPVRPGLSGIETWPDIITSIALGNWAFEKP